MNISYYRRSFEELLKGCPDEGKLHHLCARTALSFLDRYYYNDEFAEEYILLLCEMATSSEPLLAKTASSALFGFVIESLCDDFEELQTEAYNRVMSLIIDFCRRIPQAAKMDELLNGFGLDTVEKIYMRAERLRHESLKPRSFSSVKKFIVLSRVTIGADMAVTSTLIQRLLLHSPGAEISLIGSSRLNEIFGGHERIKFCPVSYQRGGNLIDRVLTWLDVFRVVSEEFSSCLPGESVLVDTDSRLSQLGVLPLVSDDNYLFFRSRGDIALSSRKLSMAELVNLWADKVFGNSAFVYPKLFLPLEIEGRGRSFIENLRSGGVKKIIFMNFGVGGNSRKRLNGDFEYLLLKKLLSEKDLIVILDKGLGEEEMRRADLICGKLRRDNFEVVELAAGDDLGSGFKTGLIGISAGIGEAASLISASDLYIGYDSACQHIATATGVKTITIFAGINNTRFVRRWRAFGPEASHLIHVDTLSSHSYFDVNDIIERVMEAYSE